VRPSRLLAVSVAAAAAAATTAPAAADETLFGKNWAEVGGWGDAWGDDQPQPVPPPTKPAPAQAAPVQATPVQPSPVQPSPAQAESTLFGRSWPEVGGWGDAWGGPPTAAAPSAQPQRSRAAQAAPQSQAAQPLAAPAAPARRPAAASTPPQPAANDPNAPQPVQMTADQIIHDRALDIVTAKGKVVVVQGTETLTADVVSYNLKQDVVSASGNVVLTEATGEVTKADYFELTGDFKNGVAEEIRLIMADHSRMAAAAATRVGGVRTDFDKAVYTPCEPCRDHPDRTPLWQAKAERVTHDQPGQEIEYRDAWIEFMGVPVVYTPYIAYPDPTVKRRSGLLIPTFGNSASLGSSLSTPYYWVMTENEDLTITPRWLFDKLGKVNISGDNIAQSALQGVVLAGEHHWTGTNGETKTVASLTADQTTGDLRGHVNAEGHFDLDRTWRAGYTVQHQSDDTYSQVYNFPIESDRPWLTSRAYLEGFGQRDYAVAEGFAFQGITQTDDIATQTPLVLPHLAYSHISNPGDAGGRWMWDSDALAYNRVVGISAQRMSSQLAWQLPYTTRLGEIYTLTTSFRGEGYHADQVASAGSPSAGRAIPEVSLEYRFPFVNNSSRFPQVVTPLAMVAASPNISNNDRIPNEDSVNFELDDTNVLRPNPVPGLDRGLGGPRAAYGLRWNGYPYRGGTLEVQVAQGWREHLDASLPAGSGFSDHLSDYVGHAEFTPVANFNVFDRLRLSKADMTVQRQEAGVNVGPRMLNTSTSYVYLEKTSEDAPIQFARRHYVNTVVSSQVTRFWSVTAGLENNLDASAAPLSWSGRLIYNDECFAMIGNITHSTVSDRDLLAGTTVTFNVVFKTLGQVPVAVF
jgi:LPS-assembly protein